MGICPRCGSWVDDGDVCRSCGGVRKTNDDYKQTPVNNGNQYNDGYNPPIHSYPYWDYDVKESKYYNKIKKCLSKKVIEELTKEGYSLEAQIYCLIETIEYLENDFNCDFEKIYYKKKPFDYIAIECINKTGKLLDARLTCKFIRDQYYLDDLNDIKLSFDEEYITKSDVFKKLKRNMEAEGYKYVRMDYYPRDFHNEYVTIWFTKSTSVIDLAKSFRFSLKNNDIHNSWESIYFDDGFYYSDDENINSRETKRLKKKIKEIEKEYKCKYEDAYGLKLSFGWKTYYYDLETKDLKKESNLLKLKQYPKEQLFTITGNSINRFKKGTKIKLVKESDNKIDYNHLAVYLDDNKIGYVSRGGYGVSGASELNISDYAYGEYLTLAVNENRLYPVFRLIKTQPKKTPYQIKRLKEETNPILKKCNEYKKAKQYTEADKCYDELIKINPTVKNYEDKAANLINMKKYEEAQKCLNKAKSISNFPNSTSIQAIQKTINEKQLKQDKVTEISTISKDNEKSEQNKIKNFKEEKIQLLKKCNEYKKAKQYTEADKCYDELIKINPTVKNWEDKAANLINMEKYEEAQESLNKAKSLSKFPNSTSIQAIQKIITNKQGKTTETPQKEEEHKKKTYKQITLFDC